MKSGLYRNPGGYVASSNSGRCMPDYRMRRHGGAGGVPRAWAARMTLSRTDRRVCRRIAPSLVVLLACLGLALPAEAQLCRGGPSFAVLPYHASLVAEAGDDTRG